MRTRAWIFAIIFTLMSAISRASGWTGDLTVTSTFTEGTTDFIAIMTSDGSVYTPGCAANYFLFTATTDARRARVYATIMTAIATGQKIRFWYTDTCSTWSYHEATSVMLVK